MEDEKVTIIEEDGKRTVMSSRDLMQNFMSAAKISIRNLQSTRDSSPTYAKYTKDNIVKYLENPANNEKALRNMSKYLYNISNYYRRLIQYFAFMPSFSYIVAPTNIDYSKKVNNKKVLSSYYNAVNELNKMNIRHEFQKVLTIAFRDDVFYGYVFETNDSFTIQPLDADYCKISSIEDGVYNFAFDFSYFDSNADKIVNYAPEFETMYRQYKTGGQSLKWQELDPAKSVCIKINEHDYVPVPPFVSLFSALADIEDYRAISKNASEVNNYKALAMKIPVDKDGNLLIEYGIAKEFYDMMLNVLPPNIGAILTPMDITDWTFDRSGATSDTNDVSNAESSMWQQAGVNKILFGGGDDPSSSTLKLSTINDQAIVFAALRQIERWINRKLKSLKGGYTYKIVFLDSTLYNKEELHAMWLKNGQYGLASRNAIMSLSGVNPADYKNMAFLENSILNMCDDEVPLKSSNTQSGEESGRPTNESQGKGLSDAGENSQEQDLSGEK